MKGLRGIARMVCAAAVAAVAVVGPAHAQLGGVLGGVLGGGKNDGSGGSAASADAFTAAYAESHYNAEDANSKLYAALGQKKEAATAAEKAESWKSGATDPELLGKVMKNKTLDNPLESTPNVSLDADSKVVYAQGLVSLAKAVVKAKEAAGMASGVVSSLAGNPLTMGASAKTTLSIAKDAPSHLTNLTSALSKAVEFGNSQGIEVPSDVTSVM